MSDRLHWEVLQPKREKTDRQLSGNSGFERNIRNTSQIDLACFHFSALLLLLLSEIGSRDDGWKSITGKHDMTPSSLRTGLVRKDYAQHPLYLLLSPQQYGVLHIPNTSYPVSNSLHICAFLFDTLFDHQKDRMDNR